MNISIDQFNEMTPYELSLFAEVFVEKLLMEKEEKVTLTWLGEYYHRLKKLPRLKDEIKMLRSDNAKNAMSDDEMFKIAQKLNSQFGGKVKDRGEGNGTT